MPTQEQIRDYDDRYATEQKAMAAVQAAMKADPPDLETLREYAGTMFDGMCASPFGRCGCAYCVARRFVEGR